MQSSMQLLSGNVGWQSFSLNVSLGSFIPGLPNREPLGLKLPQMMFPP
jgi:hypothetical protein